MKFDRNGKNGKNGILLGINMEYNYYIIMDSTDYNIHLVREAVLD